MRILIDALSAPADAGGMRRYAEEVVTAWLDLREAAEDQLIVHGDPWIREVLAPLDRVTTHVHRLPGRVGRLLDQYVTTALLGRRYKVDAVLALGPMVTPFVPRNRRACVVHDWRHRNRPDEFGRAVRAFRRLWVPSIHGAGAVAVISDKTLEETARFAPRAHPIVVPNGADHPRRWKASPAFEGTSGYVLTYGHHSNKRPDLVLRALAHLSATEPRRLIVLGARGAWAQQLTDLANELNILHLVDFPGFVDEEQYQRTIANAGVLVLASTDEGFGLPVVEGRYFGIPVVATNDNGLPEIHPTGVIYCEPTPERLADAIHVAVMQGRGASVEFSGRRWAQTAADLRAMVVSLLGQRK